MIDLKNIWFLMTESLKDWLGEAKCTLGMHKPAKVVNYRNGKIITVCSRCGKILK